jgi:hypothetical protein
MQRTMEVGTEKRSDEEWRQLNRAVARLRAGVMAVVFGMVGGAGLALATLWLVVRGGENVGKHLSLLRFYFPGYSVTWQGSILGLIYGAIVGALVGWLVAWVYNLVSARRDDH